MVKKHEGHSEHLADDDDLSVDADQDDANAFHDDFQKLVKNVKPQSSRDVKALVAMMNLVEPPKEFRMMAGVVPSIDGEIQQDE
jgi:hypothetical protein